MKGHSTIGRDRARRMRKSFTDAELKLWQLLRNRNLKEYKFRRQHPLGPYVVDFVCLDRKLVIEVDGGQHQDQIQYDARRTAELEAAGYQVLRFWNNDVLLRTNEVMQVIYSALNGAPHPSPLPVHTGRGSRQGTRTWILRQES